MKYNQNPQERTPSTDPGTRTTNSHELPLPPAPKTGMGRSLIYYCTQNLLRMDSGPHFVLGAHASDCRQRPSEAPQPGDRETRSWATKGPCPRMDTRTDAGQLTYLVVNARRVSTRSARVSQIACTVVAHA